MNKLERYIIVGIIFTVVAGILSHFVYEWSGENFILGFFFPVNESTWEHMKLVFFPMLVYGLFAVRHLKNEYICIDKAFSIGILTGIFLIPVIFYTYSGILGYDVAWLNILTFILSVIIAYVMIYKAAKSCDDSEETVFSKILVWAFFIAFIAFTYNPPELGIFTVK